MSESSLFAAVLEKPVGERSAFLEGACRGDDALRRRIEALLQAHKEDDELFEPAVSVRATEAYRPISEEPGAVIGPYKLRQKIGEGGFGVVFMAEQEKPVRRMVALKIIKPGMDTAQVIARFESERQALALMDHPHIAKVLDAGATGSGRPYFVMELVKGVPITEFCDKNHVPPEERLKLFIDICHAIQHAHHKGVIHRDIKPSNVLVTLHDGAPVVKVIDFGVAKATVQKLTERTLFTAFGQMIGTPTYMSPEQAEVSGLDIDTRSDVYSLGVLLYELLTGTTPLEFNRLREAGYAEMQRLIREEEPPRPSTRLSSLGESATIFAGNRGMDVKHLARVLAGDLDCIVMKALEKDRNRRYETPGGFAEDIGRYLRHDVIVARPPSSTYRVRKFVRRNRAAVLTGVVVVVAMASGTAVAVWQATVAQRERKNAEAGYLQARRAVDQYFTTVSESKLFDVPGLQPLRKDLLDLALKYYQDFLAQRAGDRTMTTEVGAASYRVAVLTRQIGTPADALAAFERAHELYETLVRDHPQDVKYRCDLAIVCNDFGNFARATGAADDALRLHGQARSIREQLARERPDHARMQNELAKSHANVGDVLGDKSENAEAISLYEQSRAINARLVQTNPTTLDFPGDLGQRHSTMWHIRQDLATDLDRIAFFKFRLGQQDAAIDAARQSYALFESLSQEQPGHTEASERLAGVGIRLGWQLSQSEKRDEARKLYERSRGILERLATANPSVLEFRSGLARTLNNLGNLERDAGRSDKAISQFEQARTMLGMLVRDQPAGPGYRYDLGVTWRNIAGTNHSLGRKEECVRSFREAIAVQEPLVREFPQRAAYRTGLMFSHSSLADVLHDFGRTDEASTHYRKAIEIGRQAVVDFPSDVMLHNNLAWSLATCPDPRLRDPIQALTLVRKAVELAPGNGTFQSTLGSVLYCNNDFQAAIATLDKAMSLRNGGDSIEFFFLAMAHWRQGEKDKARHWFDKGVAWMDEKRKNDPEMKRLRAEATELLGMQKRNRRG